jgi:hypothetical protein
MEISQKRITELLNERKHQILLIAAASQMDRLHDPLSWCEDVERRLTELRLGQ